MNRILAPLVALFVLLGAAFAQQQDEFQTQSKKAVEALTAKRYDEGIAALQRCLELKPKDKGTAYNMGCAYSLKADPDKAFEWLGTAADWGWGSGTGTLAGTTKPISELDMTKTDGDLESLRKDPRYDALLAKLQKAFDTRQATLKKGEEYAATAAIYIPKALEGVAEIPLLVVLHDQGSTKDKVIAGPWKAIADELGLALVAPSGKYLVQDEPAQGMAWFDDPAAYVAKPGLYEKTVTDSVSAFKKEHKLDKSKVFLAGEGTGAIVALSIGVSAPGLYKGVLAINGSVVSSMLSARGANAGHMGLKVAMRNDAVALKKGLASDDVEKQFASWRSAFEGWGIGATVASYALDAKDPAAWKKMAIEALKALQTAVAQPVEAAAPK